MKIEDDGKVKFDIWDLRALCELGSGTYTIKQINEKRESMTKTSLRRAWYSIKHRIY